jgi:hypothetical protein
VGLPLLLVIIIGSIPFFNQPRAVYGGATFLDVYVPIMVAFSAVSDRAAAVAEAFNRGLLTPEVPER